MAAILKHIASDFESIYIRLRQKEGRIYNDGELAQLPGINRLHPLYKEWKIRKQSCERLIDYLNKKNETLSILEVGCGNGWLSARLAVNTKGNVTGIDINSQELKQAQDVFKHIPGLRFINGDIRDELLDNKKFNVIVFAASIQYFSSLTEIIDCALQHLVSMGEIHILDSHFYKTHEIEEAKQRSLNHFRSVGYPDMAKLYYHHCMNDLEKYYYRILYNPFSFVNKLTGKKNPFYHICITKIKTIA
ncbi:MAG: class I SAM-dependent methyltransferase [Bacteroidota bacterium]